MSEMVERVGAAINRFGIYPGNKDENDWYTYDFLEWSNTRLNNSGSIRPKAVSRHSTHDLAIQECRRMNARAAIEAMREPTQKMVDVTDWPGCADTETLVERNWRAMIDEALK